MDHTLLVVFLNAFLSEDQYDEGETLEVSNFFASKRQELEEPMNKSSEALAESIKKSIDWGKKIKLI